MSMFHHHNRGACGATQLRLAFPPDGLRLTSVHGQHPAENGREQPFRLAGGRALVWGGSLACHPGSRVSATGQEAGLVRGQDAAPPRCWLLAEGFCRGSSGQADGKSQNLQGNLFRHWGEGSSTLGCLAWSCDLVCLWLAHTEVEHISNSGFALKTKNPEMFWFLISGVGCADCSVPLTMICLVL